MIESLYIVDPSGLCLFSAPLGPTKNFDADLVCGFITAQNQYFKDAFGESTSKFTLEKKEILIQTVDLKGKNVLLAIAHAVGNKKEEKFSKTILDNLAKTLKSKEKVFMNITDGLTRASKEELGKIVEKALKSIPCLFLVKGFLGITDHCEKIDGPITDGRPCDFDYAVKQCDYYSSRS